VNLWISAADVRAFANIDATNGRYSDAALGSNIRAAQQMIEQATGRQFDSTSGTRYFTTEGRASLAIPDVRSVTSVVLNGTALTENETYWLLPDSRFSQVNVAIQFRAFGVRRRGEWYLSVPDWFDRGLDLPGGQQESSLPNDLRIESSEWGWASPPDDVLHATKALAAWLTKRADGLLGNAVQTADGTVLDYSQFPPEFNAVKRSYSSGSQLIGIL
jgi:hypothetical protein